MIGLGFGLLPVAFFFQSSNLSFDNRLRINSVTSFGELKLIIPSNWRVESQITCIFGAVEDKRSTSHQIEQENIRCLTLTGTCFMGGVKIISY